MIFSEKTKTQPISKEQVWAAWLRVRSHHTKGSGVDDVSLEMIAQNPRKYLYPVWNRLASGSYMAPPVKEMRIPKSPRSWRTLGIPTICDRVAQDVIREELFDMWMEREYPEIPYERFADDIVVHTMTLKQSRFLLEKIRDRLRQFKLELHPKKTKIVLCFTNSRRWAAEKSVPVSFDFLGYKFCPISIPRKGQPSFWNFGIRICTRGVTHVLSQVKQITKNIIFDIVKIGEQLHPKVLGWIQYYKKAVPSSLRALFHHVNFQLIKWLMHKHREGYRKAKRRYWFLTRCYPTLFIHWQYGLTG